jgi:hypothetical protein
MKYLKTGVLSDFGTKGRSFKVNTYGRIITDSTNSLELPIGTTGQRPELGLSTNGLIRFNSSLNVIEAYFTDNQGSGWEIVKKAARTAITKQTIPGYSTETIFGPLVEIPASINNIIVIVENVVQIGTTNFVLVTDPAGPSPSREGSSYPAGTYIQFTDDDSVPTGIDITILYGFEL